MTGEVTEVEILALASRVRELQKRISSVRSVQQTSMSNHLQAAEDELLSAAHQAAFRESLELRARDGKED